MATGSLLDQQLLANFHAMSRAPFQDELTRLMQIPRSRKALRTWANKSPDRHAQAVAIMARLAGYTERQEIQHSGLFGLITELQGLSDAQLEARLTRLTTNGTNARALVSGVSLSPDASPPKGLAAGELGGQAGGRTTQQPVVLASGAA